MLNTNERVAENCLDGNNWDVERSIQAFFDDPSQYQIPVSAAPSSAGVNTGAKSSG